MTIQKVCGEFRHTPFLYLLVTQRACRSLNIAIRTGMRISVIVVANNSPKAKDIAAGIRYCACSEVSSISGVRPAMVVVVVRKIALNRPKPASFNASCILSLSALAWL